MSLWIYVYGYAVLFSAGVDAVLYKRKNGPSKKVLTVLFYIFGGYAPFLFLFHGQWSFSLFAGFYGIACALAFLFVNNLFRGWWPYNAAAAMLLLAGSIYVSTTDFTVTKQWTEKRTANGFHAEFTYFNGRREIPVELEQGQTLSYQIDWEITNGGGYGTYLDAKGGSYTNGTRDGETWISYQVKSRSIVQIVVTGDGAQGAVSIKWEIDG